MIELLANSLYPFGCGVLGARKILPTPGRKRNQDRAILYRRSLTQEIGTR